MSVQAKRRADYQPPAFSIATVDLHITLHPTETKVVSTLSIARNGAHNAPLVLDGDGLELNAIAVNGEALSEEFYTLGDNTLSINSELDTFELVITTTIAPEHNKALEGLYLSGGAYCTQCEAEGFRPITYFMDRPDVLSVYTVTVVADKSIPMLPANGNPALSSAEAGSASGQLSPTFLSCSIII